MPEYPAHIQAKINIAKQYGYSDDEINTYLAPKMAQWQEEAEQTKTGFLEPGKASLEARSLLRGAGVELPGGEKPVTERAEQLVDLLEAIYMGEEGERPLAFAEKGLLGRIPGKMAGAQVELAPESFPEATRLNTYKRTLESTRALLAKAAGDTGNIALQEQLLQGRGLPDESLTLSEAKSLFAAARQKFGLEPLTAEKRAAALAAFGSGELAEGLEIPGPMPSEERPPAMPPPPPTQTTRPEAAGFDPMQTLRGLGKRGLFGPAPAGLPILYNILKQSRTGQALKQAWEHPEESFMFAQTPREFAERFTKQTVPAATELASFKIAPGLSQSLGLKTAGATLGAARGLTAPEEMTLRERGGEAVKGAGKGWLFAAFIEALPKVPGLFKGKPPTTKPADLSAGLELKSKGIQARSQAIDEAVKAGKTVDGNTILKRLHEWADQQAKTLGPKAAQTLKARKYVKNMTPVLKGQELNPADAQTMWDTAKSGYTSSGKAGQAFDAGYYRALRDGTREALDPVAKGWEKATAIIRKGYEQEKILKPVRMGEERKAIRKGLEGAPAPVPEFLKKYGKRAAETAGMLWLLEKLGVTRKLGFGGQ